MNAECPVPDPKLHEPERRMPPSTIAPWPFGAYWPPIVTRSSAPPNTSAKPASGRYAAEAAVEEKLARPVQPNDPSSAAIAIQVSIMSRKPGSSPPASAGFMWRKRPESHIASTTRGVSVRACSHAAASAVTTSAIERTLPGAICHRVVLAVIGAGILGYDRPPPASRLRVVTPRAEPRPVQRARGDLPPRRRALVPSLFAQGPWNPDHLHGGPICGVLARAIESCASPVPMRVVRMTVEMTRAVPMAPLSVHAEVTRAGRRIQQIDAQIAAEGKTLVRATALRVRVGSADAALAIPFDEPVPERAPGPARDPEMMRLFPPGFIRSLDFLRTRVATRSEAGVIWARLRVPLVEGEAVTPFVRLATLCDFASGTGNPIDFTRFTSINPDLSLHVLRAPRGEWIGLRGAQRDRGRRHRPVCRDAVRRRGRGRARARIAAGRAR